MTVNFNNQIVTKVFLLRHLEKVRKHCHHCHHFTFCPSLSGLCRCKVNNILIYYISFSVDPRSGPAYDLQVLWRLMSVHNVPQVVPFMCFDAREVRMGNWSLLVLFWGRGQGGDGGGLRENGFSLPKEWIPCTISVIWMFLLLFK